MTTFGPNEVTLELVRDGSVIERRAGRNLITTVGISWLASAIGGAISVQGSPATAATATSFTATGTPWTVDALKGKIVVFPVTGLTTTPVRGHISSNTTSVATVDGWWTPADAAGTTPANTSAFIIVPGAGPAKWIALSDDTAVPLIADTTLASEIITDGLGRALATYANPTATTLTLSKTFTATGAHSVRKAGLFTGGSGGVLVAELAFAPLTMASTDTLAITWTWNLPAAG